MKVRVKQSGAAWTVRLQVRDKNANRRRGQKQMLLDYKGDLQTPYIAGEVFRALGQAELAIENRKAEQQ